MIARALATRIGVLFVAVDFGARRDALRSDGNLFAGRLWPLVLLTVLPAPWRPVPAGR